MSPSRHPLFIAATATLGVLLLTPVGLSLAGAVGTDVPPGDPVPTVGPAGEGGGEVAAPVPARAAAARAEVPSRAAGRQPLDQQRLVALAEERAETLAEVEERVSAEAERLDQEAAERAAEERAAGYDLDETDPKVIARQLAENRYGWGEDRQWTCIDRLITQESSWNPRAVNPSSGAYGLVQSLPAEKMASAGDDWRTNPATQLEWGFDYIEERYGTPCDAWSFHLAHNWY